MNHSERLLAIHDLAAARLEDPASLLDHNTVHDLREILRLSVIGEPAAERLAEGAAPSPMLDTDSMREWLASWPNGQNWSDASGLTIPVTKASLLALLDELDRRRLEALPKGDFSSHAAQLRAKVRTQAVEIAKLRREAPVASPWTPVGEALPADDEPIWMMLRDCPLPIPGRRFNVGWVETLETVRYELQPLDVLTHHMPRIDPTPAPPAPR